MLGRIDILTQFEHDEFETGTTLQGLRPYIGRLGNRKTPTSRLI